MILRLLVRLPEQELLALQLQLRVEWPRKHIPRGIEMLLQLILPVQVRARPSRYIEGQYPELHLRYDSEAGSSCAECLYRRGEGCP